MSRIVSIKRKQITTEKLYNLAVEKDESYVANGIVVHNCRSMLTPIMIEDTTNRNSFFFNYQNRTKEFPPWGSNIPAGATKPAVGFGG